MFKVSLIAIVCLAASGSEDRKAHVKYAQVSDKTANGQVIPIELHK
jgi:hypothetical protein